MQGAGLNPVLALLLTCFHSGIPVLSSLQLIKHSLVGVLSCHVLPRSVILGSRVPERLSGMLLPG